SGRLTLVQEARGGAGGGNDGGAVGTPGNASSSLTRVRDAQIFALTSRAVGGDAGAQNDPATVRLPGGNAVASADGTNESGTLDVLAEATGGNASNAFLLNSQSTNGVTGGHADARARGTGEGSGGGNASVEVEAVSRGGVGGRGSGVGSIGGDGGTGHAEAYGESLAGRPVTVIARDFGGRGGNGERGGNGGSSELENAVAGATTSLLTLRQEANGGQGGTGDSGTAANRLGGAGGSARSALSAAVPGWSTIDVVANGGTAGSGRNGGDAEALAEITDVGVSTDLEASAKGGLGGGGVGTRGGDAHASAVATGAGSSTVVATAEGGIGATGGDGGAAHLGPVFGSSSGGGRVSVSGTVIGGDGQTAGSTSGVDGGDGFGVFLENAVGGETSGELVLSQTALAGDGGGTNRPGGSVGTAGAATSRLTRTTASESFQMSSSATGGRGGNFSAGLSGGTVDGPAGRGGDAEALGDATNASGGVILGVQALGGAGGDAREGANEGGDGGAARVRARAESSGDGSDIQIGASFFVLHRAVGGAGGASVFSAGRPGGAGGDAFSESAGNAHGDSRVDVWDRAVGGAGGSNTASNSTPVTGARAGLASSYAAGSNAGAEDVSVHASATGGKGGGGKGALGQGAEGGFAEARAAGTSVSGHVLAEATQIGGDGGTSTQGARGGDGNSTLALDRVAGSTAGVLELRQIARGGAGGASSAPELRGNGGSAQSALLLPKNSGGGDLVVLLEATGGDGGSGGNAFAGTEARDEVGSRIALTANAKAGTATSATGLAGVASLDLYADSTAGGQIDVEGNLTGGSGFDGQVLELVNAVRGETSGDLRLVQRVTGGNGAGGTAGRASSALTHSGASESMALESRAVGGSVPTTALYTTEGADGTAIATGTNSAGSLDVHAQAFGGRGGRAGARGGDAFVEARGTTSGDGHAVRINDDASIPGSAAGAFGGLGGEAIGGASGARGGDATSFSRGEALGDSEVVVGDYAEGGQGGQDSSAAALYGDGGDASSTAIAIGAGRSRVSAHALARAGNSLNSFVGVPSPIGRAGSAIAAARASGLGPVEAWAQTTSLDPSHTPLRDASALATGAGPIEAVEARSRSIGGGIGRIDALSGIASGAAPPELGNTDPDGDPFEFAQAAAFGLADPDAQMLDLRLGGGSAVGAELAGGADALALGLLGVSFASPDFEGSVRFELSTPASGGLLLGLVNPLVAGDGFASLLFSIEIGGVVFLEQSFTDVASALAFFDDEILALGVVDLRDVKIAMRTSTANAGDRFQFDFVLMAVPEPGTGGLLLVALVALAIRRRARRC
ncbi:MAG TPA: PEP-CTERM sorting domain-containing protein, partial [Myxococcota bacterium]|nr:PEP-CTERM sorting domain-containing protein [Myxococcota bacterium]